MQRPERRLRSRRCVWLPVAVWVRCSFMLWRHLALIAVLAGCAKGSSVVESRPLKTDFDNFRSGAVEVDPRFIEGGEEASQDLLTYLEGKLRAGAILEPRPAYQGAQLLIRIHATASSGAEDMRLIVDFVDAKSGETIGQLSIAGSVAGTKGNSALRSVADEIVSYMRSHRTAAISAKASPSAAAMPSVLAPAAAATEQPLGPGVVVRGGCTTTCAPDSSSALTPDDQKRIVDAVEPLLKGTRMCLDRVSAQQINPAVIVRFESSGQMSGLKIDAGGYDDLTCVQELASRPLRVMASRAASVRCEYRCAK